MLFMAPGLVGWIAAVFWWLKRRPSPYAIAAQIVTALEVAIGGLLAWAKASLESSNSLIQSGAWDPSVLYSDHAYSTQFAMIGGGLHAILLIVTGLFCVSDFNQSRLAEQGAAPKR